MRVLAAVVSLLCASLAAVGAYAGGDSGYRPNGAAPPTPAGTGLYRCTGMIGVSSHPGQNDAYLYVTGTFPVPNAELQQLNKQWRDYVQSQHPDGIIDACGCPNVQPDPVKEKANEQGWIDSWKNRAAIIRTTWKYGQPASAATTTVVQEQPKIPTSH